MSEADRSAIKENVTKLEALGSSIGSDAVDAKAMGDLITQLLCDINRSADAIEGILKVMSPNGTVVF